MAKMPTSTTSVWRKFAADWTMNPSPRVAATSSAATRVEQLTPSACARPRGSRAGHSEGPDAPVEAVADEVHGPPVEHELAAHERATLVPAVTEHDALADEPLADRHPPLSPAAVTRPAAPLR
jgi:hypothetical protein